MSSYYKEETQKVQRALKPCMLNSLLQPFGWCAPVLSQPGPCFVSHPHRVVPLEGVALKAYPFQDHHTILAFYTPSRGLVSLLVQGVRKPGSKLAGACIPLVWQQVEGYDGKPLFKVRNFRSVNGFDAMRADLPRLAMGLVAVDWVRSLSGEGDVDAAAVFGALTQVLCQLDHQAQSPEAFPLPLALVALLHFQLHLLQVCGHLPDWFTLADTRQPLPLYSQPSLNPQSTPLAFSLDWGGVVADPAQARADGQALVAVRPQTVGLLQTLLTCEHPCAPQQLETMDNPTLLRATALLRHYVQHRLHRPLKSHDFMLDCLASPAP